MPLNWHKRHTPSPCSEKVGLRSKKIFSPQFKLDSFTDLTVLGFRGGPEAPQRLEKREERRCLSCLKGTVRNPRRKTGSDVIPSVQPRSTDGS